jgi:two-component system chemotaxis sensor kinase CheA
MLREVAEQGRVTKVTLDATRLPALEQLDPERCYLSWVIEFEVNRALGGIDDLFGFVPSAVAVELTSERAPANAPVSVPPFAVPLPPAGVAEPCSVSHAERQELAPDPVRFAAFLVRRGALSAEAALAALEAHRDARPSLAVAAVACGLLDTRRLFEVVAAALPGEGFAATAVRLGALAPTDLGALLLHQERQALTLPQCLLQAGALAPERVESELAAYRARAERSPDPARSFCEAPHEVALPANPGASMLEENGPMLPDFCAEADEHLEAVDRHLLTLDARPTDAEALNAVYRAFHSIKGVASMLALAEIQTLAHEAENLLNLARDGKVTLRGKPLDLVFASNDSLKKQVADVRRWPSVGGRLASDPAVPALLADLRAAVGAPPPSRPPLPAVPVLAPRAAPAPEPQPAAPTPPPAPRAEGNPAGSGPVPARADAAPRRGNEKETVRVDKDRLDKLVNTIGELVIAQAMAQQEFSEHAPGVASVALPELAKTSRDLQELSLSLRMVPMQATFQKMARLVRDLSRKLSKPVDLELHGEETELDKTVVDQLGDPLMHMVRNGLDHGLEQPAERVAAGKPATGRLSLRAYHQGGNIYIELTDDGRDRRSYRDTGAGFAWKKNERPGASAPGRVRCGGSEC